MPSQNNNGGPWGQGRNTAPDFVEVLKRAQDSLKQIMPDGGPLGVLVLAVLAVLVLVGLGAWTAYYAGPSDSVAVVQRFGKYQKEVPPDLHFKLPLAIDAATIVPVSDLFKFLKGMSPDGDAPNAAALVQ